MTLRILDEAHHDAQEAARWYERHRAGLGYEFLAELTEAYRKIEQHPLTHPRIEHPDVQGEIRRVLLDRFPYLVIYEMAPDGPLVLAVAHASRDSRFWIGRSPGA